MNELLLLAALAVGTDVPAASQPPALTYRFEEVKSRVYRYPKGNEKDERRAEAGQLADAGDLVRTNWLGKAVLAVPERATRFEISSSTRVRLAEGDPGVLLVLDTGRIKAFFDALTGSATVERRVATPGALLAVRGTRYGVDVDGGGKTGLAVFEGTVEVISTTPGIPPVLVTKGQYCTFKAGMTPRATPMGPMGMNERNWENRSSMSGMRPAPGTGMPGTQPGAQGNPGGAMHGGSGMGQKGH